MASTSPARRPRVASITLGPPVGSLSALSSTGSCPRCSSINSGSACAIRLDLPEPEMPVTAVSNPTPASCRRRAYGWRAPAPGRKDTAPCASPGRGAGHRARRCREPARRARPPPGPHPPATARGASGPDRVQPRTPSCRHRAAGPARRTAPGCRQDAGPPRAHQARTARRTAAS
ncbi:hypothetical protein G6F31_018416 [Rhizopus arrhizus]|nr:hypothetical protein G6F31_018416 [Rhizopus arrhizus]